MAEKLGPGVLIPIGSIIGLKCNQTRAGVVNITSRISGVAGQCAVARGRFNRGDDWIEYDSDVAKIREVVVVAARSDAFSVDDADLKVVDDQLSSRGTTVTTDLFQLL